MSGSDYRDAIDWYSRGRLSPYVVTRSVAGAAGDHCGMIEALQPAGDMSDPAVPAVTLCLQCSGSEVTGRADIGLGGFEFVAPPRSTFVVPPDTATQIEVYGPHRVRVAALPMQRYRLLLGSEFDGPSTFDFKKLHHQLLRAPRLAWLMDVLWGNDGDQAVRRLEADSIALAIFAELRRGAGHVAAAPKGLPARTVARCVEFMKDHLAEDLDLPRVAAVAGLSPFHFHRMFRAATGVAPHAYLRTLRIDAARALLRDSRLGIIEIALWVGFQSSAAFSRAFRAGTGMSPSAYRLRARGD